MHARAIFTTGVLAWMLWAPDRVVGQQRIVTGFERDVNLYTWTAAALLSQDIGAWTLSLDNRFTSDAFVLFGDRLSFRDENRLAWSAHRPIGNGFGAHLRGRALWYTQSRVFTQEIYSGLRYSPRADLWVEPALGFAWDRRPGIASEGEPPLRSDLGPAFATRASWVPAPFNDYHVQVHADGSWQVINPRRGRAIRFDGTLSRRFDDLRLSTDVRYSNYRRDAYQAVSFLNRGTPASRLSETVEATASDTLAVDVLMEAPITPALQLTSRINFGANNRLIRTLRAPEDALFFDTAFNRRTVEGELGLAYGTNGDRDVMMRLAVRGGAEVERRRLTNREDLPQTQASQKTNLLEQADYDQGLFALHGRSRAEFGRFTLNFDGSASIVRHDTPESNLDDRDELYHNGQIGALVNLSRYLSADVRLLGTYYHTVYLNSARSAENSVRRSLRLRPAFTWTPSDRTRIRFASEIRATYTVHDFVLPGRRASDQSARELRYEVDAEHRFGGGLAVFLDADVSNLSLGRLMWDEFAEIPFDTLRTYSGWLRLQVLSDGGIAANVGVRFYIRSDFDRATTVRYPRVDELGEAIRDAAGEVVESSITRPARSWIEQIGPTCSISWPMRGLSRLHLEGWLNVQHIRHRLYGDLPEDETDRIREAGRRGDRKIIPNLSMTVEWRL